MSRPSDPNKSSNYEGIALSRFCPIALQKLYRVEKQVAHINELAVQDRIFHDTLLVVLRSRGMHWLLKALQRETKKKIKYSRKHFLRRYPTPTRRATNSKHDSSAADSTPVTFVPLVQPVHACVDCEKNNLRLQKAVLKHVLCFCILSLYNVTMHLTGATCCLQLGGGGLQ